MFTQEQIERFWNNVDQSGDCWIWKLSKDKDGYGKVEIGQKAYISHRVAYEISNLVSPGKMSVLHSCDNPPCCNPSHLFLGTHLDNMRDMANKQRSHPKHHPKKLTINIANQIRAEFEKGTSKRAIAKYFGVSCKSVREIINREYWK